MLIPCPAIPDRNRAALTRGFMKILYALNRYAATTTEQQRRVIKPFGNLFSPYNEPVIHCRLRVWQLCVLSRTATVTCATTWASTLTNSGNLHPAVLPEMARPLLPACLCVAEVRYSVEDGWAFLRTAQGFRRVYRISRTSLITGFLSRFAPSARPSSFVADFRRALAQARAAAGLIRNQAVCAQWRGVVILRR
jgi:hypothetical protein